MVIRTQVQLSPEQAQALKELAARRGVSVAELIRQGVERVLAEDDRAAKWRRAFEVVGKFQSGHTDISTEHDRYLAEDYLS